MKIGWGGALDRGVGVLLCLLISNTASAKLNHRLFVDYDEKSVMQAGAATDLIVEVFDDASPEALHHFHVMHEKPMHLLVLNEDLSELSHVHPEPLGNHTGLFGIRINDPAAPLGFDNQDAKSAVTKPGKYFLFAEAMPMGFGMTTFSMDLTAGPPPQKLRTAPASISVDPVREDGAIIKEQDGYRVTAKVEALVECTNTLIVAFTGAIDVWDSIQNTYLPVEDLEPWLGAYAHAVFVSEKGSTASAKSLLHLHTVWPLADDPSGPKGPEIELAIDQHGNQVFEEGRYKVWLQFKHRGVLKKIPFGIDLRLKPARRC